MSYSVCPECKATVRDPDVAEHSLWCQAWDGYGMCGCEALDVIGPHDCLPGKAHDPVAEEEWLAGLMWSHYLGRNLGMAGALQAAYNAGGWNELKRQLGRHAGLY